MNITITSNGKVITHISQIHGWESVDDDQRDDVLAIFAEVQETDFVEDEDEDEDVKFDYDGSLDPDNIDEDILNDIGDDYAEHEMQGWIQAEDLGEGKFLVVCHAYCDRVYDIVITDDCRQAAIEYLKDWDSLSYDDDLEQWLVDWHIPGAGLRETGPDDEAPFALCRVTYGHNGLPWPSCTWIRHSPDEDVVTYETYNEAKAARKAMGDSNVVVCRWTYSPTA